MFLTSILKKISSSTSNKTVNEKPVDAVSDCSTSNPNLPSWKDKSLWSTCTLKPSDEAICKEIKETILGLIYQ